MVLFWGWRAAGESVMQTRGRPAAIPKLAAILLMLFLAACGGGGSGDGGGSRDGSGSRDGAGGTSDAEGPGAQQESSGGAEAVAGDLFITGAWARSMPAGFNGAVYLEVENRGNTPIRLRAAGSAIAERVEMHETVRDGDMLRMVHQPDGIELAAAATQRFEPGGFHIMLFDLGEALEAGQRFSLELVAEPGGPVTVEVLVRAD